MPRLTITGSPTAAEQFDKYQHQDVRLGKTAQTSETLWQGSKHKAHWLLPLCHD